MLAMTAVRRMEPSYDPADGSASMREALRALRASGVSAAGTAAPLEVAQRGDEPPRVEGATPIEGTIVAARRVDGVPVAGVAAFLDGIQRSRVLAHAGVVPFVHGAVAAAIRVRQDRRLRTWESPVVDQALYVPVAALGPEFAAALSSRCRVRDTEVEPL
ncbi:MAG: hypothetical protein ACYC0B_10360, partial [Gemmatimonadaceae bacterium]